MPSNQSVHVVLHAWQRRGWLACLLWPVSWLFGVLLALRRFAYRRGWLTSQRLPVPVIVIGNIFVGGTGKTPLTIWLLERLREAGLHPGVMSRGYGGTMQDATVVTAQSVATEVGDEPLLIARQSGCPVVVGRNRADAGRLLLQTYPEVNLLLADDGLQHLALQRDIEVMLFDGRGIGNGWLLPAGPLREPASRPRDFTVVNLNGADQPDPRLPQDAYRMQLQGVDAWQLANPGQRRPLATFATHGKVLAAAGIGNPERFFAMLRQQGIALQALPLPDHFDFRDNPFDGSDADLILITEKDAVKCRQLQHIASDLRIWVVTAQVQVAGGFAEAVLKKLEMRRSGRESPIA